MANVKVKYMRSHPQDAYFVGDIAMVSDEKAAERLKSGHIMLLPEDGDNDKINPLPEDLPARDILFEAGFDTAGKVKEAGESITDVKGIGKGTYRQIVAYFEK
jgi:hypothetical protein